LKTLATILLACSLAACSGSLFRSHAPPTTTYLLTARPAGDAAAAAPQVPIDLTVLLPRVRTGLDTDHIAVLYPDGRLDYFAAARWSGPLDEVMQDLLLQAFRSYAHFRNVHTDTSAFNGAGYWLEVDVVDFQAEYPAGPDAGAPEAHVKLLARVGTARERRILGQFEAEARVRAFDNRLGAVAAACNQAVDQALAALTADAARTLEGSPTASRDQ
jgi:cholesterol transport system auxiliary component